MRPRIDAIYKEQGIEYQQVFDTLLESELGHIDPKILASGIVAYRAAAAPTLVLYPHVQMTLLELAKRGIKLGGGLRRAASSGLAAALRAVAAARVRRRRHLR